MEAYFNIIYTGPNIYGIQEAAHYYFNKNINDLTLAQCAFLAGINNAPNSYNPFSDTDKTEKITKRTKTVLNKMLELGYISEEEYNNANSEVDFSLDFNKGEIINNSTVYSYHTDALINEVISDLANTKNISQDFATNFLYLSGSSIYTTQNAQIQETLEKECKEKKYILKSSNGESTSQTAMVIIDQSTGYVVAVSGGLGEKTSSRCFNRATQMKRQTGSAMKPIAVLLPAISKKLITNVTVFADEPTTFTDYNGELYSPVDYDDYMGSITLRQAVESSQNIPFVKIIEELTPEVSIKYLEKMGITTLNDKDNNLALSLGGLDEGISPLEFAGAYATIANDGKYIEPTFYKKITSSSGETILTSKQKKRRVVSKDVACILKQLLTEPVVRKCTEQLHIVLFKELMLLQKLGTTNENYDRWLAGFTPYYTAVCWFGFDMNESINFNNRNPAGLIWSSVMKQIHSGLPNAKFEMTDGVVTKTICRDSGKLANSSCPNTFTEYFLKDTIPDVCTQHSGSNLNNKQKSNTNKTNSNTHENKAPTPKNTTPQEAEDEIQNTNLNTDITSNTTNSNIENTNIDNSNSSSSSSNTITNNSSNAQSTSTNTVNNATSNSITSNNVEVNNTSTDNELSN